MLDMSSKWWQMRTIPELWNRFLFQHHHPSALYVRLFCFLVNCAAESAADWYDAHIRMKTTIFYHLLLIDQVTHESALSTWNLTINIIWVINLGSKQSRSEQVRHCIVGVKVRNMKMDFNAGGTWHRIWQWTLMMKINDFFIRLSHYQAINNNM